MSLVHYYFISLMNQFCSVVLLCELTWALMILLSPVRPLYIRGSSLFDYLLIRPA